MIDGNEFEITIGIFDYLCKEIRRAISEKSQLPVEHGVGVYTDEFCETVLKTHPLKSTEERMEIASCFLRSLKVG